MDVAHKQLRTWSPTFEQCVRLTIRRMRSTLGLVLICSVYLLGHRVGSAKDKQAAALSNKGNQLKKKAKENKNVATTTGSEDEWDEIKAMRMDRTNAALPGLFYNYSYKRSKNQPNRKRNHRRRYQYRHRNGSANGARGKTPSSDFTSI
ncbi:unnamed protein product [Cylicocyclus nassatus]|uniref:Uncharacterized protein n=1 Tax=Cylicocyclus nassatus TaxID=53992 RepID=A0AA36DPB9_CYLNA|nr:unnamed protein product [Cylicocyclus nassatus]